MLKLVTLVCAAVVVDAASIITGRPAANPKEEWAFQTLWRELQQSSVVPEREEK